MQKNLENKAKIKKKGAIDRFKNIKIPCFQGENEDLMLILGLIYNKKP